MTAAGVAFGSLVVELGLDTSGLKRGQQEVEDQLKTLKDKFTQQGSQLEYTAKNVGYAVSTVTSTLGNCSACT